MLLLSSELSDKTAHLHEHKSIAKDLIGLQYLRGVAVILVVIHHSFANTLEHLLGGFGVAIFFVISGFIMWYTTVAANISVSEFLRRRIIRIVPLYWIFLSAMVIVVLLAPASVNSTIITPANTIKSFLFIPHFHAVQNIIAPIFVPGWSLNYEMFFYFVFGLSLLVSRKSFRVVLLSIFFITLVSLGLASKPMGAIAESYTNPALLLFLEGILLALLYRRNFLSSNIFGFTLICLSLLSRLMSVIYDFRLFDNSIEFSPTLLVAGALALEFSGSPRSERSIANRWECVVFYLLEPSLFFKTL